MKLRVATRASPLALIQTQSVVDLLLSQISQNPDLAGKVEIEILPTKTEGDLDLETPIAELGRQAVFASALEQALSDGVADIAIHSAKDLSSTLPPDLSIGAVTEREDARDVIVGVASLDDLPQNAKVATGAPRRKAQLRQLRPDLELFDLRGNIQTRLKRLKDYDAVVVAKAALTRLELDPQPSLVLTTQQMTPQVGQGCLAVEYKTSRTDLAPLLESINHLPSFRCLEAERSFLKTCGGDCEQAVGAYAEPIPTTSDSLTSPIQLRMIAMRESVDPQIPADPQIVRTELTSQPGESPVELGIRLAERLFSPP